MPWYTISALFSSQTFFLCDMLYGTRQSFPCQRSSSTWTDYIMVRCSQGFIHREYIRSRVVCVFNKTTQDKQTANICVFDISTEFLSWIPAPSTVIVSATPRCRNDAIIRIIRLPLGAAFGLPALSHPEYPIKFPSPNMLRRLSFLHKRDDHAWAFDFYSY